MRSRLLSVLVAVAAMLSVSSALAANDLVLRQRIAASATSGKDPWEQTQYYSASLRITDDPRFRTIIDLDKRTLTIINKAKQTYSVSTFAELQKRNASNDTRVKELPGKVRDMVHADVKVKLKPTGKSETIVGFASKEYSFDAPGIYGSVWITEDLDLGPRTAEWDKLAPVFGGQDSPAGHLEASISQQKGVVLRRIATMEPLPLVTTEVLEVKREPIPAEAKAIPAGFTKVALPAPKSQLKPAPTKAPKP